MPKTEYYASNPKDYGKTFVSDGKHIVAGNYNPIKETGESSKYTKKNAQGERMTAHTRLAKDAGIEAKYAGSIKEDGRVEFRSKSVNKAVHGRLDLQNSPDAMREMEKAMAKCELQTTHQYRNR